jgi:tetratricopeptide (TPR) repeat protein
LHEIRTNQNYIDLISILDKLSDFYENMGRTVEAEASYRKALALSSNTGRQKTGFTVHTAERLAHFYRRQGHYADAEPLFRLTVRSTRKAVGERYQLRHIYNLATLYVQMGQDKDAEPLYLQILEMSNHQKPNIIFLDSITELSAIYARRGKRPESNPTYRLARKSRDALLRNQRASVQQHVANLAATYAGNKRDADAESLYLAILQANDSRRPSDFANSIVSALTSLYYRAERYPEAQALHKRMELAREEARHLCLVKGKKRYCVKEALETK